MADKIDDKPGKDDADKKAEPQPPVKDEVNVKVDVETKRTPEPSESPPEP